MLAIQPASEAATNADKGKPLERAWLDRGSASSPALPAASNLTFPSSFDHHNTAKILDDG